jgi:hypothetical protein
MRPEWAGAIGIDRMLNLNAMTICTLAVNEPRLSNYGKQNKSLKLTPWGSPGSVHAVLNSMRCWVGAAGQLSSMLYMPQGR